MLNDHCHRVATNLQSINIIIIIIIIIIITNIYNKKSKGPALMELFTAKGKLIFFY